MSVGLKLFSRLAFVVTVVLAGGSLFFTAGKGVDADLVSLLGEASGDGLREAASAMSASAKFLVKADSADAARGRLAALGVKLPPSESRLKILTALTPYAHGFLSSATRGLLEKGEFAAVRDAATARLFSPVPPVVSPRKDPFLLFTDYVLSMESPHGEWVAVSADLTPEQAHAALSAVKDADDVRCAGAPFHTAVASASSKKEINVLSAISLFCVLLFGWILTKSFRFVPLLLLALAASFCVSSAALFAFFPKPHAVAFVFGTALIGMSVDYVYHAMTAGSTVTKPLAVSYLSTTACFLPLLFSEAGILNQMAVFMISGLTVVFAGVLAFGCTGTRREEVRAPEVGPERNVRVHPSGRIRSCLVVLLFLGVPLYFGYRCGVPDPERSDVSRMYRPDPYLAEGERIAMEISGGTGFVPSAKEQERNFRLVEMLYAAEGKRYCGMTGLPLSVLELPAEKRVFAPRERIEEALDRWDSEARKLHLAVMLALAAVFAVAFGWRASVDFMSTVLCACIGVSAILFLSGEESNFFATVCFFVFTGLGLDYCVFRRYMLKSGNRAAGADATSRAVFFSFLTSFIGFGLLSFTDFAVTRVMGIALSSGLAISYAASVLLCGRSVPAAGLGGNRENRSAAWHEQRERCASLFWARFMWYSYAWFGKNFQKIIFVIGMPVIYLLSGPARSSLGRFYSVLSGFTGKETRATVPRLFMHILGFAWGLMDKTDSCTMRKNPPEMTVRDDEGWHAFRNTVNSGKGAFLLCTHVGTIGVLPSLPEALERNGCGGMRVPKVNAFQQMGHDAVFMRVFMEHFDASRLRLHAVEDIGVETAVAMKDAIDRGELVIMAGDRVSAGSKSVLKRRFMGRECVWPKGVYRFAGLMESPVFAVTCVRTGWNRYEAHFVSLDTRPEAMLDGFVAFLERETVLYPGQWYQFYDFFGSEDVSSGNIAGNAVSAGKNLHLRKMT